jgi:hypothetical protein
MSVSCRKWHQIIKFVKLDMANANIKQELAESAVLRALGLIVDAGNGAHIKMLH